MESTAAATREAAALFRELVEYCEAAEAAARGTLHLNTTDFKALKVLCEQPGLGPGELARRLGISTAATTAVLDRLEVRGYISRQLHATDRRRSTLRVHATLLDDPWRPARQLLRDAVGTMAAMPPGTREQLLECLREMNARMRQTISHLPPPTDQQRSDAK